MKKQYKIKRYRRIHTSYKPGFFKIFLTVAAVAVLAFVGISIYEPVYDFIMGNYEPSPQIVSEGEPEIQEPPQQEQEQEEAVQPVPEQSSLQIAYLPGEIARDDALLTDFLASLEGTGINSVLVDIKDRQGNVLFQSQNENALAWNAVSASGVDLKALAARLEQNGLALTVRLSAFCDQVAPYGNRGNAVRYQDTEWLWLDAAADAGGKAWLNPYAPGARDYITGLAVEAVEAGAKLVVLQDVQFPDNSDSRDASFGAESQNVSRQQVLSGFVSEATAAVEAAGGQLGVYVTAVSVTQTTSNEVRYGGSPLSVLDNTVVLGLLPYQFTAGFSAEGLEIQEPYRQPVEAVKTALAYVQGQLEASGANARIIPLLQGATDPAAEGLEIGPQQLQEQIDAARAAGLEDYVLYQTAGTYSLQ